jgi:tocopherol O-methyltransferase
MEFDETLRGRGSAL